MSRPFLRSSSGKYHTIVYVVLTAQFTQLLNTQRDAIHKVVVVTVVLLPMLILVRTNTTILIESSGPEASSVALTLTEHPKKKTIGEPWFPGLTLKSWLISSNS
jgi:hypothetical protein